MIKKALILGLALLCVTGVVSAQRDSTQILNQVFDPAHSAFIGNAVATGGAGTNTSVYTLDQIFNKIYDPVSGGLKLNCVTGCSSASGTVTSVAQSFTGGLITVGGSPITGAGTLALTVAGTSGGIPYFSGASTWASSALLAANGFVLGGGSGTAPATLANLSYSGTTFTVPPSTSLNTSDASTLTAGETITGPGFIGNSAGNGGFQAASGSATPVTGIANTLTYTGVSNVPCVVITTGGCTNFVLSGGALGTPSSGTLTNATGLPLGAGVTATFSAPLSLSTNTLSITGAAGQVLAGATPAFTATPTLGTASSVAGSLTLAPNGTASPTTEGQHEWDGNLLLPVYGSNSATFNGTKNQTTVVALGANSVYDCLSSVSVTGCTTATSAQPFATTYVIPANELVAGKVLRVKFYVQTIEATGGTTFTFFVKVGATTLFSGISATLAATKGGFYELDLIGTTTVGSATVICNGTGLISGSGVSSTTTSATLTTSGSLTLQPSGNFGAGTSTNQIELMAISAEYL